MKALKIWVFMAISWLIVDWIIAGDILLRLIGIHTDNNAFVYVMRATPATGCWIMFQHSDGWGKLSMYIGMLVCGLAAAPTMLFIRILQTIAINPKVVNNIPGHAVLLFILVVAVLIAAKVSVCVYWWKKLHESLVSLDKLDG